MNLQLPVFKLLVESRRAKLTILEIGCGNGRALLELQSLMPHSTTFCVNKKGYNYAQASTRNELALIAEHYRIPILCSTGGHHNNRNKNVGAEKIKSQPILPHIRLTSGVQNEAFKYPHASMKLILSQHAINEGKVEPQDIFMVLPRIAMLLAPGGYAALLLMSNRVDMLYATGSSRWPGDAEFEIVKIVHVNVTAAMRYSIYLYRVQNNSLGMVIQRCRLKTQHRPLWGCLQDRLMNSTEPRKLDHYYNRRNAEAFQAALSATAMLPPTNISSWVGPYLPAHIVKYAFQYFKMLHIWLEHVEREPATILSLVDNMFVNAFNFSGLKTPLNAVECTRNELTASDVQVAGGKDWKEHEYTSRSLSELLKNLPPSVYEDILESQHANLTILEIGCGNGRALLELQSLMPHSTTFCVNKK
eukprot:gene25167-33688_t